jgi:hypothetical protein
MRKYITEILGFALVGVIVWVMLGGDLPGIWVADASSFVGESSGNTGLMEPARIDIATTAERTVTRFDTRTSADAPAPAESSPVAQIITLTTGVLAILVSAFGVALLLVWWIGRQRIARQASQLVTPQGVVVEVSAPPLQPAARPAPSIGAYPVAAYRPATRTRPKARALAHAVPPQLPAPQLPAPQPAAEAAARMGSGAAWTVLAPDLALRLQQRLGWTPADDDLVPNREKRILELQAKLGATTARVAPNHSLAIFPNVLLPLDELQRKAAPQPAVLTVDDHGTPIVVVGLFYTDRLTAPERQQAAAVVPQEPERAVASTETPTQERSWTSIARPARISDDLPLAIDAFLSEIFVIAGRRRTGKSYTLGVVLEELCRYRFPLAVVDLEGEAYGLRARVPILIAGRSSTTEVDVPVAPAQAHALAQWVHGQGQQLILDLSDYPRDEQIAFVTAFAEGLWEAAKTAEPRRRFALVIDEAHEVYPQSQPTGASEILDRLVLRGGKWGITMGFATQRPANLHINARTQAGLAFLHLVEQARDIKAYADMLPKEWTEVRIGEAMQSLGRGKVLAKITQAHAPTDVHTVQIRQRITPHMGYSPGMDEQAPPKPDRAALDAHLLADLRHALHEPDRVPNHARTADEHPTPTSDPVPPPVPALEPYELTDIDRRMLTLAMTDFEGRWPLKQLWPRIKELGWVSWDDLNKRMTPTLCAAGYLAKDDQGRWFVTPQGRAAVTSAKIDQPPAALARAA